MCKAADVPDEFDFYPCRINDRPASLLVNLWYLGRAPVEGYGSLVYVFLKMSEPGEHGMGTTATMQALGPVENLLAEALKKEDVHYSGRIRGEGCWQLYYYARDGAATERRIKELLRKHSGPFETAAKLDPEWKTFSDVLAPDDERRQWIQDGRVVEVLKSHGDPLTEARSVEHWIYFQTPEARDAFVRSVASKGFATVSESHDP